MRTCASLLWPAALEPVSVITWAPEERPATLIVSPLPRRNDMCVPFGSLRAGFVGRALDSG